MRQVEQGRIKPNYWIPVIGSVLFLGYLGVYFVLVACYLPYIPAVKETFDFRKSSEGSILFRGDAAGLYILLCLTVGGVLSAATTMGALKLWQAVKIKSSANSQSNE